jgi:transposase
MRGKENLQPNMFSYISLEDRIKPDHPLVPIRNLVNAILKEMSNHFDSLYSMFGRPSIPPEYLLRGSILQILFSIRSERLLMENIEYNLLYRWFVGLGLDDPVWDHSTFSKNRNRLLEGEVTHRFLTIVVEKAKELNLLSDDHFTIDGTLIEAWASMKSYQPKNDSEQQPEDNSRNPNINFHGKERKNDTHESKTDPEARLYKKSKGSEAKLCYMGHVLMENRNGIAVGSLVTSATGKAEREAGLKLVNELGGSHRITLGADKGYDAQDFANELREINVTPHIAARKNTRSIDGRTTRHEGYVTSQRIRKRVEEIFGWAKTVGIMRKVKIRGKDFIDALFKLCIAVYNLIRIRNIRLSYY